MRIISFSQRRPVKWLLCPTVWSLFQPVSSSIWLWLLFPGFCPEFGINSVVQIFWEILSSHRVRWDKDGYQTPSICFSARWIPEAHLTTFNAGLKLFLKYSTSCTISKDLQTVSQVVTFSQMILDIWSYYLYLFSHINTLKTVLIRTPEMWLFVTEIFSNSQLKSKVVSVL